MSYDRRTGKPVAVTVVKLDPGTASFELHSDKRVTGVVCTEAKPVKAKGPNTGGGGGIPSQLSGQEGTGRVSYEQSGEHFFLPFGVEDIEDAALLSNGDEVTFLIATDKR